MNNNDPRKQVVYLRNENNKPIKKKVELSEAQHQYYQDKYDRLAELYDKTVEEYNKLKAELRVANEGLVVAYMHGVEKGKAKNEST